MTLLARSRFVVAAAKPQPPTVPIDGAHGHPALVAAIEKLTARVTELEATLETLQNQHR